ncbi:MAG: ATP-binding protein [Bacteroidota bacterium]
MNHLEESNKVEFKLVWKDDYLRQICGFTNANGGMMYIGVNDQGIVVGIKNAKRLLEEIPNKSANMMGVIVQVETLYENGLPYLCVDIPESSLPVSLKGKYYVRSGTTTQELNGSSLYSFLFKRHHISWDEIGVESATFEDIDSNAVRRFIELSIAANRLTPEARTLDVQVLFENLHLIDESQNIRRAALLAFAKDPTRFFPSMYVKIGRFITETDIIVQDVIENNLFTMIEYVMDILKTKYLKSIISYRGIHREEKLEYPVGALREAVLNALIHRDYTGAVTQIRIKDNSLEIWNAGLLPEELKVEMLYGQHSSIPRNRSLANLFFRAGYIESWGRGTIAIAHGCIEYGLPTPLFKEQFGGFSIEFYKQEQVTPQVTPQDTMQDTMQDAMQVAMQVEELLSIITGEMSRDVLQEKSGIKNRDYFRKSYIKPALDSGLIEMTLPDKPNSKNQKYRLTAKGISRLKSISTKK